MPGVPRFLLGATLLFWGAMTERLVPGLACALMVESAGWNGVRWNFGDKAFLNGWRLSVLLLFFAMILVVLQGERMKAMAVVFTWLPVILMPLQFVQSYGLSPTMTLATFSMLVRRRRDHARKHGLPFREVRFSFGHVYFVAALLASCLGEKAKEGFFFPGMMLLVGWAIIGAQGRGWRGLGVATAFALLLAGGGGLAGQFGLSKLYHYVTHGRFGGGGDGGPNPRESQTSIGNLGRLKQSPEIKWRLIPESGPLPKLLRVASYGTFTNVTWRSHRMPIGTEMDRDGFVPLAEIANPANPEDLEDRFIIAPPELEDLNQAADPALPRFRLRGATNAGRLVLMPLPANAASLHEFETEDFERSPFGTFRFNPSQPVADARVLWGDAFATELPPWKSDDRQNFSAGSEGSDRDYRNVVVEPDLLVPEAEAAVIRRVVDDLDLRSGSVREKIDRLRTYFTRDYRYSRYNSVSEKFNRQTDGTYIARFLLETKAGHCEFFATAGALLLREAGVPTRYCTGFAVMEFDRRANQAIIRGTHAHAWCRAWDAAAGRWIDVDLTPADWLGLEGPPRMSRFQGVTDWIQRKREDLLVWRDRPGHKALLTGGMLLPVLVGLAFIGRNLWRSRSRLEAEKARRHGTATLPATPLLSLEKPARKLLGERPPGTPLGPWLLQLSPRLTRPEALAEALRLHQSLRFDPQPGDPDLIARLKTLVDALRGDLGKAG